METETKKEDPCQKSFVFVQSKAGEIQWLGDINRGEGGGGIPFL